MSLHDRIEPIDIEPEPIDGVVYAAGPITRQPMTRPYRLELSYNNAGSEWIVATRFVDNGARAGSSYFGDDFQAATVAFCEKLARDAKSHYGSLTRED